MAMPWADPNARDMAGPWTRTTRRDRPFPQTGAAHLGLYPGERYLPTDKRKHIKNAGTSRRKKGKRNPEKKQHEVNEIEREHRSLAAQGPANNPTNIDQH